MRTINKVIYYESRSDIFTHWHMTDIHLGHAACDEAQLMRDIETIAADPHATWGAGGDMIDGIGRKGDPRYMETSLAPWLQNRGDPVGKQVRQFVNLFAPIADKCLYIGLGNHESKVFEKLDRDVYEEICRGIADAADKEIRELAIGWEAFVRLRFRRGTPEKYGGSTKIDIYTHHGAGGGRKQGGHALRLEEVLQTYVCDLALLGHRHIRQIVTKNVVSPSGNGIKQEERIGIWGGSYLGPYIPVREGDSYPSMNYPQAKQLAPTTTGIVPVLIKPDVRKVMPLITNGNVSEFLSMWRPHLEELAEVA